MKAVGRVGQKIGQIVDNGRTAIKGLASLASRGIRGAKGRVDEMAESAAEGAGDAVGKTKRLESAGSAGSDAKRLESAGSAGSDAKRLETPEIGKPPGGDAAGDGANATGDIAERGARGGRTAPDGANTTGDLAERGAQGAVKKKSLTQKAKTVAAYGTGATLIGTAAYSGIDAAASGKNFNETFEKNLSTVAGGVGSAAKTTLVAGGTIATPIVSGVAGGLSEGLGINNMFSGINSSMISFFIVIIVLYFVLAGDSQQSN